MLIWVAYSHHQTQARYVSDFKTGELVIGPGTTVNKLDYNNLSRTKMTVTIESGATVKNVIN